MASNEQKLEWSRHIADLIIDALLYPKIIAKSDMDRATDIAAEEIYVRIVMEDDPDHHVLGRWLDEPGEEE